MWRCVARIGASALLAAALQASASALAGEGEARAAARADRASVKAIQRLAHRIEGVPGDYNALITRLSKARFVLLGEETHGTQEIYVERARITRRLIEEFGFDGVVIESDFTPVERVNRYVLGKGNDRDAATALAEHRRFPDWMWVNAPFADLVEWLRQRNADAATAAQVFGMDLHGLPAAAAALQRNLERQTPAHRAAIAAALACLETHGFDPDRYRDAIEAAGEGASCAAATAQAATVITDWQGGEAAQHLDAATRFSMARTLALVVASEAYSRLRASSSVESWNLRDRYFADTVEAIAHEIERTTGRPARLVLWAHNSHMADARATDRGRLAGYLSLGQELRVRDPAGTYIVGFTTRLGTVRAAPQWGEPDRVYRLRRPAWESASALFGRARIPAFWLRFDGGEEHAAALDQTLTLRAIGVVYWPHAERGQHYFGGDLLRMFDAVIHLDRTQALERLPERPAR